MHTPSFRIIIPKHRLIIISLFFTRIYVDAVFNNMAEIGRWGKGSAGSAFDSDFREFAAVPYGNADFNGASKCPSSNTFVNDYTNADEVRNCSYIGWTDLDQSRDNVREKVIKSSQ